MWLQITSAGSPKSFSEISGMIKNKAREKNNIELQNNGRVSDKLTYLKLWGRERFLCEHFLKKKNEYFLKA